MNTTAQQTMETRDAAEILAIRDEVLARTAHVVDGPADARLKIDRILQLDDQVVALQQQVDRTRKTLRDLLASLTDAERDALAARLEQRP